MRCFKRLSIAWILALLLSYAANGQDLLKAGDLSNIKVDQLSDADISKLQQQLKSSGFTVSQAEQMAAAKGMPQGEIIKLRERLSHTEAASRAAPATANDAKEPVLNEYKTVEKSTQGKVSVFGSQLFTTASLSFEPNLRIATPMDYLLGPDDELLLNIYGVQEAGFRLTVQPEGVIAIPQVGQVHVAGLSLEDAIAQIKSKLASTVYHSIKTGATHLSITLGKIKSIRVTILGASKPGVYTVSSLTTLFNALYLAGGPDNNIGSYREIALIRSGKVNRKIDLYEFLMMGYVKDNVLLKEGDVINIPVYKKRVTIAGQVKRPGTYEMLENENADQLIHCAGGFTEQAYTASIKVTSLTPTQRKVKDLVNTAFNTYIPQKGDEFLVNGILDKYENRVQIKGAIFREGQYELTPGLTVNGLIKKSDGLKQEAFLERGLLTRTKDDMTMENISFSVKNIINGDTDIVLKKEDVVQIASIFDLKDESVVTINGEVRKPGQFLYRENTGLKDLIFEAGGFTNAAANYRIEIARRIKNDNGKTIPDSIAEILNVGAEKDLAVRRFRYLLQPFDIVTVRRAPGYAEQRKVAIKGEVVFPGEYTLRYKTERIGQLILRSGGFTNAAYIEGIYLLRHIRDSPSEQKEKMEKATAINTKGSDSVLIEKIANPVSKIAVNMRSVIANPYSPDNLMLVEGDEIVIPKINELVKITGEVYSPTEVKYQQGQRLQYYIGRAGGYNDYARGSKIYVIYPNGQVAKTKTALWGLVRSYPKIKTGTEIFVPRIVKTEHKRLSTGEVVGLSSVMVSMAGVAVTLINSLNK
jgi:protein involved in polysaccharide export with SLBB domain